LKFLNTYHLLTFPFLSFLTEREREREETELETERQRHTERQGEFD
jgi:hypothetical protein